MRLLFRQISQLPFHASRCWPARVLMRKREISTRPSRAVVGSSSPSRFSASWTTWEDLSCVPTASSSGWHLEYEDPVTPNYFESTFCVSQLLPSGAYDGNFGPGGLGYVQFNRFATWPANTTMNDMIILRDGRIALLGTVSDDSTVEQVFLLGILRADGTALDSTVGAGSGYIKNSFGGNPGTALSLVQQSDGKILVAGSSDRHQR